MSRPSLPSAARPGPWAALALLVLIGAAWLGTGAIGADLDDRGWHTGEAAKGTARTIGPLAEEPIELVFPKAIATKMADKTLLVYFSPTCPHCRHVAAELQGLHERLDGAAIVLGVATGHSRPEDVAAFTRDFGLTFELFHDTTGAVGTAMNARSTPSALLVERAGPREFTVVDLWYPYAPGTDHLVRMRVADDPWSVLAEGHYVGNRTCSACHVTEAESWALSHHSIAWQTLVERDKDDDPACVGCHVTGQGQPTGWDGSHATERLTDVGCEACHGPSGPHDGEVTEPRTTCEGCHDAKHSIAFTYDKGLPLIDHFRSAPMSTAEFREARRALHAGEVDKGLLAFAEGETVGAAACQGCHEAEHAWWGDDPHSQAMATLAASGSHTDGSCVACHATPKVTGPRAAAPKPEDHRTEEGVGCESCHGPGKAHVEAGGGTDNIEGLGESCPVCVIEAVCTSCHDNTWDADWDLDRDLPRVTHRAPAPPADAPSEDAGPTAPAEAPPSDDVDDAGSAAPADPEAPASPGSPSRPTP